MNIHSLTTHPPAKNICGVSLQNGIAEFSKAAEIDWDLFEKCKKNNRNSLTQCDTSLQKPDTIQTLDMWSNN